VVAFEVDLALLRKCEVPSAKQISPFPSVRRDLAFVLPESVPWARVEALVRETAGELLADLLIFDQFSGATVEKGYKSLAIGLILQDVSCTLNEQVVESTVQSVIGALEQQLEAKLRG
jgi:phenylalanyl-tRNA synthetase beta chain